MTSIELADKVMDTAKILNKIGMSFKEWDKMKKECINEIMNGTEHRRIIIDDFMEISVDPKTNKREEIMEEKTVLALKDSIAHWERMIRWVGGKYKYFSVSAEEMLACIGEKWSTEYCSLCKVFHTNSFGFDCKRCPLCIKYGGCSKGSENAYDSVAHSRFWEEWHKNARKMLDQLKSLLPAEKPEEKPVGKLVIEVLQTKWGKIWRVIEQTYRDKEFNNGKEKFEASNGFYIYSWDVPDCEFSQVAFLGSYSICVRGKNSNGDYLVNRVLSEEWLAKLRVAVKGYNECQRKLVGKSEICLNISNDTETIQ